MSNNQIGQRVLIREALAPLQRRYEGNERKLRAIDAFRDRVVVDGKPIRARIEHPVIAARYWMQEMKIALNFRKLDEATLLHTPSNPDELPADVRAEVFGSRMNTLGKMAGIGFGIGMFAITTSIFAATLYGAFVWQYVNSVASRRILDHALDRFDETMKLLEERLPLKS